MKVPCVADLIADASARANGLVLLEWQGAAVVKTHDDFGASLSIPCRKFRVVLSQYAQCPSALAVLVVEPRKRKWRVIMVENLADSAPLRIETRSGSRVLFTSAGHDPMSDVLPRELERRMRLAAGPPAPGKAPGCIGDME